VAATLPAGWEERAWKVQNANTRNNIGGCIEAHDLAASKLVACREKDRDFVRLLMAREMIKPRTLITRIRGLPKAEAFKQRRSTRSREYAQLLPGVT
jgi:hypothetical protein